MRSSSTPRLVINLLGPLTVRVDGQPAPFRTDAERALLAVLAADQGVPQRRDTLAALLAPDRPDAEALTYLRNRLARLREALADERAAPSWLTLDRKQIALRAGDDIAIDLAQFAAALAAVERHAHRELAGCPSCLVLLHEAVGLLRGEFLAGLNFASEPWQGWLAARREHVQLRALEATTLLREALLARGDWAVVLDVAQGQLALEPWLEPAHRAIMAAHAQLGDRAAALAQFAQCERQLWDEFGAEPEAATLQLRQQIADGELAAPGASVLRDTMPLQSGRFFGREAESAQLLRRLVDPAYRLVTIVGAGGMGKTRLAIEAGRQLGASFPDGVWFVALNAIAVRADASADHQGAEQVMIAVGEALGLAQHGKQLAGEQVLAILRDKRLLLILDNCEVALDALAFVPEWLRRAPGLAVLATSRAPLGFQDEALLALDALPGGDGEPGAAEALFAERAGMARDDFALSDENLPLVQQICGLVDGSPLGIGLAAAWVRRRSLRQIHDAIGRSLDFLSSGQRDVDQRHRSMRAVFEASWQLLSPGEAAALAALAVFPATFSAEAAAAVAGPDLLTLDALCDKSLLQQQREAERYQLHSLLRQFAADKLAERTADVERAFVAYVVRFARRHRDDYERLQPEWHNLSAAVATAHRLAAWQSVIELAELLDEPWFRQIRFQELREGLTLALDAASALRDEPALAKTLLRLGEVEMELNAYPVAETHLAGATALFVRLEDSLGIAQATFLLGRIKLEQAQDDQALALSIAAQRLFEDEHDWLGAARALNLIALCHLKQNPDLAVAQARLEQSVALLRPLAPSATLVEALRYLARVKSIGGAYAAAEQDLVEAATVSVALQDLGEEAAVLFDRLVLCRRQGRFEAALRFGDACLDRFQKLGSLRWEALVKTQLAIVHQAMGQHQEALALFTTGLQLFAELGDVYEQAYSHFYLHKLYAELGERGQSLHFRQQALQLNIRLQDPQLAARLA